MAADDAGVRSALSAALAGVVLATSLPAAPARADTLDQVRAEVAAATARVDALQPRLDRALAAYQRTLEDLAAGVSRSVLADQAADAAAVAVVRARSAEVAQVRALYMNGGGLALAASVLDAATAGEAIHRVQYVQRLVALSDRDADDLQAEAEGLRVEAADLESAADDRTARAADVQQRYDELSAALATAAAEVAALSRRAQELAEAQALAARLAALDAAVAAAGAARVASARASVVPLLFRRLYHAAARTCPGMSWTLLAAIGQVESGHGANPGTSYAGARGPMQFMPATFVAYGVDGDDDGDVDIDDPADAVFSAANYLCANGAGRGRLEGAIWNYNHAQWYVDLVLRLAGQYAARDEG